MSRGLPWSVLLHVLVLTLAVVYGNQVQRRVVEPPQLIRARLVRPEALAPPAEQPPAETPAAEPEPNPPPREEPEPLPPKEVPEARPEPEPEPEPEKPAEPERRTEPQDTAPADAPDEEPAEDAPLGPSVRGTDTDFPFAWYLATVEGQIARNWRPRQLGFGERSRVSAAVHFVIGRSGAVSQVTVVEGSGVSVFDREALRAVQSTRLPPLPPQYGGAALGVTFIFNLEPGM